MMLTKRTLSRMKAVPIELFAVVHRKYILKYYFIHSITMLVLTNWLCVY